MTVSTLVNRADYVATASQTIFPYPFRIFADADLRVFIDGVLQTLTTDYTVSDAGEVDGGNVTLVVPATGSEAVAVIRLLSRTQGTDYVENDPFPADTHEDALDRSIMIAQEVDETLGRALKMGESSLTDPGVVPEPVSGLFLGWNSLLKLVNITQSDPGDATGVDETDTDVVKDKMVSNLLAKEWEDYKDVGHLPLTGGRLTGVLEQFLGTAIDSAATVDLALANGNFFQVSGNTGPITSFGSPPAGAVYYLFFDSTPTITHSATVDLPGDQDITMDAGDGARVLSVGGGTVRLEIFRTSGRALIDTIFAASKAEMEAATDDTKTVTPLRVYDHPAAAKGWVLTNTGTTVLASLNVSSLTGDGTGDITVNWDTDFSSVNYSAVVTADDDNALCHVDAKAAGTLQARAREHAGSFTDVNFNVVAFGDQ